jgi:DNA end-binding protein Ku
MRAIWTGEISFGLVTIPAKLYSATKDLTPQFHQLHKVCGSRIGMVRRCPKCNRDVAYEEVGKGYEVSKGEYALFSKEELAEIEGKDSGGGIDIAEFIDPMAVDLAYIDKSYWVGPGGKSARGFDLLRTVLEKTGKVALAKVKIRTRTRLGMLRPREKFFSLEMMRFADELVKSDDIVVPDSRPATAREEELAIGLVKQLTGPFDPSKHPDEYRAGVEAAVGAKIEADEIRRDTVGEDEREQISAAGGAKVIDLADLLARSLKAKSANKQETSDDEEAPNAKPGPAKTKTASDKKAKKKAG